MPSIIHRRSVSILLATLAGAALTLAPSACSDSAETTGGKRLTLAMRVASAEAGAPVLNQKGWTVNLTTAAISTGPLYFYEGAPIFSDARPPLRKPGLLRELVLGSGVAYAHPGHYVAGEARGQMLKGSSVDLLGGAAVYPDAEGVSGLVRSATFSFASPATGPLADELTTHVIVVEGLATKESESRAFRAEITPQDVLHDGQLIVEGCPFAETDMQSDGTITLNISLTHWFDQVDFADVESSADGKPTLLDRDSIAFNQLARGLKVGAAYSFSFTPGTP